MLHAVHFTLAPGQKVGGVGVNGCGKTTLLRIVAGDLSPDAGIVRWHDPAAQEEAHRCLTLQQPTKASSAAGLGPEERRLLRQLGLPEDRAGLPWPVLSGGQRAKLALARTLAQAGRLLLLDEPTNHLDVRSRLWLEQWLKAFKGAVILISHDRDFLDHTVARIDEISGGKLRSFPGNYTAYAARAKAVERRLQKMEEKPRPAKPPAPQELSVALGDRVCLPRRPPGRGEPAGG